MKRILSLMLVIVLALGIFAGCGEAVSEVADNVLSAAQEELVSQIRQKAEEYKVTVKETKAAVGTLNDDGGKYQFYCAILVQTNTESSAEDCANALGKVFGQGGYAAQSDSAVESEHLVHKTLTYDCADYSEGNYYTVYVYVPDITKVVDLTAIKDAITNAVSTANT